MRHESYWWSLPGPNAFLESVEGVLREGANVVLAWPEHHPAGFRAALGDRLRRTELMRFRILDLSDEANEALAGRPAELLHDRFAALQSPGDIPSPASIEASPELRETAVWVEGLSAATWPKWRRFLLEYKDICRSRNDYERLLFVVSVTGELSNDLPNCDVTLAVRSWKGVVRRLDMLLYAARAAERIAVHGVYRDLAHSVVAEVAGVDPLLADCLTVGRLEDLLDPQDILQQEASRRSWMGNVPCLENGSPLWSRGMADTRDGQLVTHSVAEAARCGAAAIARRVWRGQIGVLFPFLEEQRLQLVQEFRHLLRIPFQTMFDTINDVEQLELTHLRYQLRHRVSQGQLKHLDCVLRIRNSLAHLQPANGAELLSPEFAALAGNGQANGPT